MKFAQGCPRLRRCSFLLSIAAFMGFGAQLPAQADELPQRMTIVVPFSPGASNDLFARALSQYLQRQLHVEAIVDNRPGAGGAIGSAYVARAKPDGATLLLTSVSFSTNAAVQKNLGFDPVKSFAPVALLARGPMLMVVGASTPYKTPADYIAAARKPGAHLNYGSPGVGSIAHLGGELFSSMAGISTTHVPYKGVSNAVTDMLGNNLEMMITTAASVNGALQSGGIRAIAVTSPKPSSFAPGLPAIADSVPGFSLEVWWAVLAPANTPAAIVDQLNTAINAWSQTPEMRQMYARESTEPAALRPPELDAFLASEIDKWRKVAKDRNITLD